MHGRLKVRSTEEQEERKRLEREKKLKAYKYAMSECLTRISKKEYDQVGMKISEEILTSNCDIQTLWNFRKNIILSLDEQNSFSNDEEHARLYANEMSLTEICLKKNPKSYGVWYHRQWCLLRAHELNLDKSSAALTWKNELDLCNLFLNLDERNFHCWKHRYFVIDHSSLSKLDELEFTYEKICTNFSNYSAWHYRSKLIEHLYYQNQIDADMFKKELNLIENAIYTDPNDQSAWIYEKWLLLEHQRSKIKELIYDPSSTLLKFKFATEINLNTDLISLQINGIQLKFNNVVNSINWLNSNGNSHEISSEWSGSINSSNEIQKNEAAKRNLEFLKAHDQIKIEICLKNSGASCEIILEKAGEQLFQYKSKFEMKNMSLDKELIENHLNSVLELSKLEADKSKWCLLTALELMCIIDFNKYRDTIFKSLDELADVDSYRSKFYMDLKQKIINNNSFS